MRRRTAVLIAVLAAAVVAVAAVSLRAGDRQTGGPPVTATSTSSLLALTWGPSLCAVTPGNSGCRSGHVGRRGPVFVLHGLWPQPSSEQYCDVPQKARGPRSPVPLPDDLRSQLQTRMSDASVMAPHEWYAHGTCSGVTPPEYFRIAADLADQAGTVLDPLFAAARGRDISSRTVREAVATRLGPDAGRRVALTCRDSGGGAVVYEVRLSLPAVVELRAGPGPVSLRDALAHGPAIPPGCGRAGVP